MRSRINKYFIGSLLQQASPFEVTRIKLIYNFTLFYGLTSLGVAFLIFEYSSFYGLTAILFLTFFIFLILSFLRNGKTNQAILSYLALHILIGPTILILKRGIFSPGDYEIGIVLVIFGWLTLNRTGAILWSCFILSEGLIAILHTTGKLNFLQFESEKMPGIPESFPEGEIVFPFILATYIFWIFTGSKNKAEKIIQEQKNGLETKNREIHESLTYAKNIQHALLPDNVQLNNYLNEHFILFQPKDVVSGDFYWFHPLDESRYLFAVADCTGHGVPGAMVSVICSGALTKSVTDHKLTEPGQILDKSKDIISNQFRKNNNQLNDGMDISLMLVDNKNKIIRWAGANNSLWICRNLSLLEFKPDKQPVGVSLKNSSFTTHTIPLEKGDIAYLFSDGFADQFGGKSGKKLKYHQLKELLIRNNKLRMQEQKVNLKSFLTSWQGDLEQTDDVCLVGIRF